MAERVFGDTVVIFFGSIVCNLKINILVNMVGNVFFSREIWTRIDLGW